MKTKKIKNTWSFYYKIQQNIKWHGLYNCNNEQINYFYQDVPKGFGLIDDLNDIVV
jgi:glucan biosynthesis protein